ncbi:MAG: hypothetical protein JO184_09960, partial [Gammaproteobacteria bacterium]|nr:hypothetical protein [Gammaproteobacteria bacterium]
MHVIVVAVLTATLLLVSEAGAQQPAPAAPSAANPLDTVPDKMPFDTPYGAPIALERATAAITA